MQILSKNYPCVKIKVNNSEDFWYLSELVSVKDLVSGLTERRIKVGQEPNIKTIKKVVYLKIEVEKIDFEPGKHVKFLGKVKEGPDDVGIDTYHSFTVKNADTITFCKEIWDSVFKSKLNQSTASVEDSLLVLFDRESAMFVKIRKNSYEILSTVQGDVSKKGMDSQNSNFYALINSYLLDYKESAGFDKFILASPSFWSEYLKKELDASILKKSVFASVSDVSESSISQALQSKELGKTLTDFRVSFEKKKLEHILERISKDMAAYGINDCKEKSSIGSISELLVSDNFLASHKENKTFHLISDLMKSVESMDGSVVIITGKDEMQKLDSLGGVAGVLRWKA